MQSIETMNEWQIMAEIREIEIFLEDVGLDEDGFYRITPEPSEEMSYINEMEARQIELKKCLWKSSKEKNTKIVPDEQATIKREKSLEKKLTDYEKYLLVYRNLRIAEDEYLDHTHQSLTEIIEHEISHAIIALALESFDSRAVKNTYEYWGRADMKMMLMKKHRPAQYRIEYADTIPF